MKFKKDQEVWGIAFCSSCGWWHLTSNEKPSVIVRWTKDDDGSEWFWIEGRTFYREWNGLNKGSRPVTDNMSGDELFLTKREAIVACKKRN